MLFPSGAQRGEAVSGAPSEVNCTAFKPSRSHFQISMSPERFDRNAMLLPSGEYCASFSPLEEAINLTAGPVAPSVMGRLTRQMFKSPSPVVYARFP